MVQLELYSEDSIHLGWMAVAKKNVTASVLFRKNPLDVSGVGRWTGSPVLPLSTHLSQRFSRRSWERMWARHTSLVLQIHPRLWASNFPSSRLSFTCDCKQTLWKTKQKRLNFKHLPYSWVALPLASLSKWLLTKKPIVVLCVFYILYIYTYQPVTKRKKKGDDHQEPEKVLHLRGWVRVFCRVFVVERWIDWS